ncbi:MAG: FtsX-like permease family protein, partial [Cyclobacteriaceae bacterium]
RDGTDPADLEAKIPDLTQQKVGEMLAARNTGVEFQLQPIEEIHLTSDYQGEFKPNGNKQTVILLFFVGLFILAMAWINYINLSTARSMKRAREIGVRKILGSFRSQIIKQFMFEFSFSSVLSLILAIILIAVLLPYFNSFMGINQSYMLPDTPLFWASFIMMLLLGTFLSGVYPALVISGYKPVTILKNKLGATSSGNSIRKVLVVFQFLVSVILITCTYVVYQQLNHLQDQDLGITVDETLIVRTPNMNRDSVYFSKYDVFKNSLLSESDVLTLTSSTDVPGNQPQYNVGGIRLMEQPQDQVNQFKAIYADDQFMDLYELEILEGRGFDDSFSAEISNLILNESAAKLLGINDLEAAINKKMVYGRDTANIIGIIKDYRQQSPKSAYEPIIFRYAEAVPGFYSMKISTKNMNKIIAKTEEYWKSAYGDHTFEYFFLDDYYNKQYRNENRFGKIFSLFTGLAIIVACLGLFGLASITTELRTKEISIRKVLGSQSSQLLLLLSKDFMKLVL